MIEVHVIVHLECPRVHLLIEVAQRYRNTNKQVEMNRSHFFLFLRRVITTTLLLMMRGDRLLHLVNRI